jgi:protein phosphatase
MHVEGDFVLLHAGLLPSWSVEKAQALAGEVEATLRAPLYLEFLATMYGNKPEKWSENLRGMATTAAAVLFGPKDAKPVIAHVGDSRIYLWRGGHIQQITQDHSWVGEQVRAGVLTETDARRHPWRNVVTRALSGGDDPDVDVSDLQVANGDRLLICSDGLSGVVPPDKLEKIISQSDDLQATCQALIDAANEAGGPDNITVAMLKVDVA